MATTSSSRSSFDDDSTASTSAHLNSEPLSILQPIGYSASQCGYCAEVKGMRSDKKGGRSYGCWAHVMTCKTYKDLIDRGWRRSGKYLYKPDMRETCCPQYTISLETEKFAATKSQRQLLKRFSNFVMQGGREGTVGWGPVAIPPTLPPPPTLPADPTRSTTKSTLTPDSMLSTAISVNFNPDTKPSIEDEEFLPPNPKRGKKGKGNGMNLNTVPESDESGGVRGKGKGKANGKGAQPVDLVELVHESEWDRSPAAEPHKHRFEYKMEPASFTDEKYELFRLYQTQIHGEPDSKVTRKGFIRFLVDTPLEIEPTSSPKHSFGSFHGLYILDGVLIAFAVLDVLPGAVSSVYFVWSPEWAAMGLGKVSALREASMVREMKRDGVGEMESYMMGFYIHTCQKMAYKAAYQPSSLLDPSTNVWYSWDHCKKYLDVDTHAAFSAPLVPKVPRESSPEVVEVMEEEVEQSEGEGYSEEGDDTVSWPPVPPPGCLDPSSLHKSIIMGTVLLESKSLVPLMFSSAWQEEETAMEIRCCLAALGEGLCRRVALYVG